MITLPVETNGKPVKPLGVVWYEGPEVYARMQGMCPDMVQEPFETWSAAAAKALEASPEERPRVQVPLDPAVFGAWCRANHLIPNAIARQRYVHDAIEAAFTRAIKAHKARKKDGRRW